MSSTTRGKTTGLDRYYTPEALASACVSTLGNLRGLRAWEPHVGAGAFARALRSRGALVHATDLDPAAEGFRDADTSWVGDFLAVDPPEGVDLIVGNPPFNAAEEHVRRALKLRPRYGVGFLLRLAFLAGQDRGTGLWRDYPPVAVYVCSRRPSFTGGATDSADYAWFVWDTIARGGTPRLDWIRWSA